MEPAHPTGAHGGSAVVGNATPTAPAIREHDRLMPIANVIRIMRGMLPANAKISDDAKEMMQEIVSEFISFVTTEANDRCLREQRKTVTADDLLHALSRLGFDDYVPPVGVYLLRYRQSERESRRHGAGSGTGAQVVVPHEMQMPAAMYGSAPPPHGFGMPPNVLQQHGQFGQYEMYGGPSGAGGGAADESGGVGLYGAGGGLGDVIGGAAVYRAGGGVAGGSGGSSGASSSRGLPPAMPPNFDCQDN